VEVSRHRNIKLIGVILLVLFLAGFPFLKSSWGVNQAALDAMAVCLGQEDFSVMQGHPPFFRAGAARCLGDLETAHANYLETVGADPRVTILHAVMPFDIELARQMAVDHPNVAEANFWLGEAIVAGMQAGEIQPDMLEQAITAYERGLAMDPFNGEEWDNIGRLYETKGAWEQAVEAFNWACRYGDFGRNGCINAARVYAQHALYEQAASRYMDSLRQRPGYVPALRGLSNALLALDRVEEAMPYLQNLADQGDVEAQTLLEQLSVSP
jgi:tetratricopeptide (TPR) repeat protein